MFDKLELLKLNKHPIYKFNEENLDGLMLDVSLCNSSFCCLFKYFLCVAFLQFSILIFGLNLFLNDNRSVSSMSCHCL